MTLYQLATSRVYRDIERTWSLAVLFEFVEATEVARFLAMAGVLVGDSKTRTQKNSVYVECREERKVVIALVYREVVACLWRNDDGDSRDLELGPPP